MNIELENKILSNCTIFDIANSNWRNMSGLLIYDVKTSDQIPIEKHIDTQDLLHQFRHYNKLKFLNIFTIPNYNRLYILFSFETEPNINNRIKFLLQDLEFKGLYKIKQYCFHSLVDIFYQYNNIMKPKKSITLKSIIETNGEIDKIMELADNKPKNILLILKILYYIKLLKN